MRLLDRYLLRELLIPLAYILGGLLIVLDAFDLFLSGLNKIQEKHLTFPDVLELYVVRLPGTFVLILPIVLLLALLYTLTNHARHNELTAIRAAGVGLWRICLPYLGVGLLLSLGYFYLNEHWVPDAVSREETIMHRHDATKPDAPDRDDVGPGGFRNSENGRHWIFKTYNLRTHVMTELRALWKSDNDVQFTLIASHADYINGIWTFFDAIETAGSDKIAQTNVLAMPEFTETPDEMDRQLSFDRRLASRTSANVPISAILNYLDLHRHDLGKEDRARLTTQLHGRYAAPWTCVVVVLIAIPFGAASGRRNLFAGVAGSIVICFAYFVLMQLGLALGTHGQLPAWLAAWLPNLAFGLTGFWMTLRVR
jgi:lipopolysaccharide export system permease protein